MTVRGMTYVVMTTARVAPLRQMSLGQSSRQYVCSPCSYVVCTSLLNSRKGMLRQNDAKIKRDLNKLLNKNGGLDD